MQFLRHNTDDTVLRSAAFAADIAVLGLSPNQLRPLFGHIGADLVQPTFAPAQPLTVHNQDAVAPVAKSDPILRRFAEGTVQAVSGGGATVRIDARDARFMLPQPLGFALTQQWARSGLLALHGCMVQINGRGILALGRRGTGKSILAASVLAAQGAVVSDDWVLVGATAKRQLMAERLRQYLQLRASAVGSELRAQLDRQMAFYAHTRTKFALPINDDHPASPPQAKISELWVLRRPSAARSKKTRLSTASPAVFFAALLDSSVAELVGNQFPVERMALLGTLQKLIGTLRCVVVETGSELASDPVGAWSDLQ
jgi:hypothetical protein